MGLLGWIHSLTTGPILSRTELWTDLKAMASVMVEDTSLETLNVCCGCYQSTTYLRGIAKIIQSQLFIQDLLSVLVLIWGGYYSSLLIALGCQTFSVATSMIWTICLSANSYLLLL